MSVDQLPLPLQTVFAELVDRLAADELETAFPFGGSFVRRTVKSRDYWYFVPSKTGPDGKRAQRYVGPDTPELRQRIEHVLRGVDSTFREVPYVFDGRLTAAYAGRQGYRVEVLIPNRGAERDASQPLPAIGAMGQPLRFLDFLIYDAVPAALLHDGGVLVNVPRPERYALHKLIVSRRRREGAAKIDKDLAQAETLLRILAERRKADLRDAWAELQKRGPKWRQLSRDGLEQIDAAVRERVLAAV